MHKFGLLGRSLKHSFSKDFFESYFKEHNIDAQYHNFELENINEFPELVKSNSIDGLNVTIPYKESIIPFLDELSDEAMKIGAINVVQFKDGKLIGHNTDAYGFRQSVKPFLTFHHERALIIGTGGASKAVAFALRELGIDVIFLSRAPKADNEFPYGLANEHMIRACKLIVNTTPVGMFPDIETFVPIEFNSLSVDHLVVDLIYNPAETKFLQLVKLQGATILNGESMLKHQALKSWEIWNSKS